MASPVLNPSEVANRIRLELETAAHRGHSRGQLAKVTSLLHAFRGGDSSTSIQTVERALEGAGVVLEQAPRERGYVREDRARPADVGESGGKCADRSTSQARDPDQRVVGRPAPFHGGAAGRKVSRGSHA